MTLTDEIINVSNSKSEAVLDVFLAKYCPKEVLEAVEYETYGIKLLFFAGFSVGSYAKGVQMSAEIKSILAQYT